MCESDSLLESKKYNKQLLLRVGELKAQLAALEKQQNALKKTVAEQKAQLAKQADYAKVVEERDALREDLTIMFLTEQRLQQELDFEASRVAMLRGLNERIMKKHQMLKSDFSIAESILRSQLEQEIK